MVWQDSHVRQEARRALNAAALVAMLALTTACQSPNAAQVGGAGWEVQRFLAFDSVWASIAEQLVLERLPNDSWHELVAGGYVTTDAAGQGRIQRDECTVYVFQTSSWGFSREEVAACEKALPSAMCSAASTAQFQNCAVSAVTLPATVTMQGTVVTVVYNREAGVTLALVHEGMVKMTPAQDPEAAFEVPANVAGLVTRGEFRPVEWEEAARIVEELGQADQVQRANMLAHEQGLPVVPLVNPFALGLRVPGVRADDGLVQAFLYAADWPSLMKRSYPNQDVPIYMTVARREVDLRQAPYSPDRSREILAEAGYPNGIELVLWYDGAIKELAPLTDYLAGMLADAGIYAEVRPATPDEVAEVFTAAGDSQEPALFVGAR